METNWYIAGALSVPCLSEVASFYNSPTTGPSYEVDLHGGQFGSWLSFARRQSWPDDDGGDNVFVRLLSFKSLGLRARTVPRRWLY